VQRVQPIRSNHVLPSGSPIIDARDAYFRGDFDACSSALDAATSLGPAEQREAVLLRARLLLRLLRFREAVQLLGPALTTFVIIDEACTARMLHAVGVLRSGKPDSIDRGMALLEEVQAGARTFHAHKAIAGEIEYWLAFGYWMRRDYQATLRHAVAAERAEADVLSVRAASLRGYVAAAKECYPQALALFKSALGKYRTCRERDADLVERIVFQVVALEVALKSANEPGTHNQGAIGTRLLDVKETPRRPGALRMQIAALDAWLFAFDGDKETACELARIGDRLAPTPAWQTWALANRAQITALFGELTAAREFAMDAVELADTVDWDSTNEERVGLLLLAEALAMTNPLAALPILHRYDTLTSDVDRALLMRDDVRLWILETHVRGLVHRIRGEHREALAAFEGVRAEAERVGIVWRATLALIEMDATPVGGRGEFYLETAARMVRAHFPHSFLARRLGKWNRAYHDPLVAKLPPAQRRVLRHLMDAKTQKEIAAATGLAVGTVGQYVKALLKAFGVRSTLEVVVACYKRGIGSPSWPTEDERRPAADGSH
jgi:DNA-binding CsgD family transcriptional regulator/tetratricopeptide (TPR) repeat protein